MTDSTLDFHTIYEAYRFRIIRYLTRLVGPSEAEDLTQEVFVRISKGLREFRGEANLSTWIYRIATNVATDRLRSRSFKEARTSTSISQDGRPIEDFDLSTGEKKPPIEKQVMRGEMSSCVHDFIGSLPENYRAVVTLSDVEELNNQEIAEILGLSLETVKIRLHRGRAKLKSVLESGCRFDRDEDDVLVCDRKPDPEHPE